MSSFTLGCRVAAAAGWTSAHAALLRGRDRDGLWPTWEYEIIGEEDVDGNPLGVSAARSPGVTSIPPEEREIHGAGR